jgi:hypothetical protein
VTPRTGPKGKPLKRFMISHNFAVTRYRKVCKYAQNKATQLKVEAHLESEVSV